ncbi:uncharacterized protein LOC142336337 [Convolutriloba macropyga]|uniref:uncharacterized protein LOC142336337 n=1 Tax=Convolutriloba macropyga TaxID=536237 RepID=UPI003F51C667
MAATIRKDFYQKDNTVCATFYVKNIKADSSTIDITEHQLHIKLDTPNGVLKETYELFNAVEPDKCSFKIMSTKLEVKLCSTTFIKWTSLEKPVNDNASVPATTVNLTTTSGDTSSVHTYPSSSVKKQPADWNKLETDLIKEEKEEKKEGDEGLNQLFQNIFKDGTPEQQKAMIKSFTESGGTVLSTNWDEVGGKKVEVQPPDGMEFKKWDN